MGARQLDWYGYDPEETLECGCGWSGPAGEQEDYFREVLDVCCPECEAMLLIVSYPTHGETRKAAAEGNPAAIAELEKVERIEGFWQRAKAGQLAGPDQLPDLDGDRIVIDWDFEDPATENDDSLTVLRHRGREIWREIAFYEGADRYFKVAQILRQRYGERLQDLRPTAASQLYLLGDDMQAGDAIDAFRRRLADGPWPGA